jgi:hypothetical protein
MQHRYGIDDLVAARVGAARFADKHPDLSEFYVTRYQAMSRAFGIEDGPVDTLDVDRVALADLVDASVRALVELHSPFAIFLEAPQSIHALHARFSPAIDAGIEQTKTAIVEVLTAAVAELHGFDEDRTVGVDDLRRYGFEPSTPWPDEFDYF